MTILQYRLKFKTIEITQINVYYQTHGKIFIENILNIYELCSAIVYLVHMYLIQIWEISFEL